jgi:two-component system OmpR family response regulator
MAGLRVLLVEDRATPRVATAQLLRAEGADVLVASDGATAIRLLQQFEPDVLLLDMMLPDMSGADVLRSMSTANASRPAGSVIVMTGDLTADRLDEIRSLGADVFLPKPVVLDELLAHLRGLAAVATSVAATPVSAAPSAARSGASVAASDEDDSPGNGQRSAKARSPVPDSSAGSDP